MPEGRDLSKKVCVLKGDMMIGDFFKRHKSLFEDKIYSDEPVISRPAQKKEHVPEPIRSIRTLAHGTGAYSQPAAQIFVKQAKLLENYEDDCEFEGNVIRYRPTYQSFSDIELRGFFAWRTKVRKGEISLTSISFAYLYMYELINQIGCRDPLDGYGKLKGFGERYSQLDDRIGDHFNRLLRDYIIYYDLPASYLEDRDGYIENDRNMYILLNLQEHGDEAVTMAVNSFSPYRIDKSRFYKEYPEEMIEITASVLRFMEEYYKKNYKQTWTDAYICRAGRVSEDLFLGAVFHDINKEKYRVYRINSLRRYCKDHGRWYHEGYFYGEKRPKLRELMRSIDSIMREVYGYKNTIKPAECAGWIQIFIRKAAEEQLKRKKEAEAKIIRIDVSRLDEIRNDSEYTRERLTVEEEEETQLEAFEVSADEKTEAFREDPGTEHGLSSEEYRFLKCILYGKDTSWVRQSGLMPLVLADAINEKLFEIFGDNVLDECEITEDYIEELKEMIADES